jgi:Na+/H+ antiporter NhaC
MNTARILFKLSLSLAVLGFVSAVIQASTGANMVVAGVTAWILSFLCGVAFIVAIIVSLVTGEFKRRHNIARYHSKEN